MAAGIVDRIPNTARTRASMLGRYPEGGEVDCSQAAFADQEGVEELSSS